MTLFHTILIALCAAAVAFLVAAIYFTRRTQRKVSYMLDAIEDKETNFRFKDTKTIGRRFNRTLNRIRTIFDRESEEIKEQERYYGQMLDHVLTGSAVRRGVCRFSTCFGGKCAESHFLHRSPHPARFTVGDRDHPQGKTSQNSDVQRYGRGNG